MRMVHPMRGGVSHVKSWWLVLLLFACILVVILNKQLRVLHERYEPDITKIDYSTDHIQRLLHEWREKKDVYSGAKKPKSSARIYFEDKVDPERDWDGMKKLKIRHNYEPPELIRPKFNRSDYDPEGATVYVEPYLVSITVTEPLNCSTLGAIRPLTPICLYNRAEDVYISEMIRHEGAWELSMLKRVQGFLKRDLELGLIDLGANIGQYSLVAANMGHDVLAVEPFSGNLLRFQKAIQIGNLGHKIKILKNGVSDHRDVSTLAVNRDNKGDARVRNENMKHASGHSCNKDTKCEQIKLILLDDILPYLTFRKAVMKIDIQGYEHKAFIYAKNLFNEIYIPYIMMEWSMMREHYVTVVHESQEKFEVLDMIDFLLERGYEVMSMNTGKKLDPEHWEGWPEDVLWVHTLSDFLS